MLLKRIVDASPSILLSKAGRLELLRLGGYAVVVPEVVLAEVRAKRGDDPVAQAVTEAGWIVIAPSTTPPKAVVDCRIDPGESAVLALAFGDPECEVVVDDMAGRKCARRLGIRCPGTFGLVLLARKLGEIPTVRPIIEQLRRAGLHLGDDIVEEALGRIGE